MGNERSALNGIEIDDKPLEVTDFWTHYRAIVDGPNLKVVSIFISEPSLHSSASFGRPSPLERAAKNLMLHRHPCILRYISTARKGSKFLLTAEEVSPLIQTLQRQSTLQICIGLHGVLRALTFLHEKASASHNNVCPSSIYVTPEGCWRLSGLEFLCKFADLTPAYFEGLKTYRYENAIAEGEDVQKLIEGGRLGAIDVYAFGALAEGILKSRSADDVPGLSDFKQFCKENLQNPDVSLRSELSLILQHPFFTHDFMRIYAFLEELPLKANSEKEEFFSDLVQRLKKFPETIVAEQLGRLLLSRIVLLDVTAQSKLLPFILRPRDCEEAAGEARRRSETAKSSDPDDLTYSRDVDSSSSSNAECASASNNSNDEDSPCSEFLFALPTFKKHITPRLKQIFCIRDASIRTLLLIHFDSFVRSFQVEELKTCILPELLVGIKDTNDELVALTLKSLSYVVPILGAATVIGGKRGKLFTDGRPKGKSEKLERAKGGQEAASEEKRVKAENGRVTGCYNTDVQVSNLPERPSPDGGEDKGKETEFEPHVQEEDSAWSDWEAQEGENQKSGAAKSAKTVEEGVLLPESTENIPSKREIPSSPGAKQKEQPRYAKKPVISDITELDIKHSKSMAGAKEEFDFFTDMEPVIRKTQVLQIEEVTVGRSMFDVRNLSATLNEGAEDADDGWGEDLSDWGAEEGQELRL